ncbi:MAG TPA: serine/threonine-protein kinase [Kofleriaceae bacterium]|nr:serine/threonine-protein kinase [Kofleriaceae bacterium]
MADGRETRRPPPPGDDDPTQLGARAGVRRVDDPAAQAGPPGSFGGTPGPYAEPPESLADPAPPVSAPGSAHGSSPSGASQAGASRSSASSPSSPADPSDPPPPVMPADWRAETVQIRTRRESAPSADPSVARSASSPAEALFQEEIARTRMFALFCVIIDLCAIVGLPFLGGNRLVRDILVGELAVNAVAAVYLYFSLRDPGRHRQWIIVSLAVLACVTGYTAILYWGVNSAAPCLVVLGIYFFSRAQSVAAALMVYGLCAGLQAVLGVLILSGVVADPGMYTGAELPLSMHVITQVLLQFIFFTAHTLARSTRIGTLRAIDSLLQARRQVEQREAMFQEVRQDLDRALQLGGPGRHTDRVLGSYRLGVVIGRGAMGEVYEAAHAESGGRVAVKLLHANVMHNPGAIERFLREAVAAGSLQSPHVVRILDSSPPHGNLPYLVMELLSGHDLAHHLRKRRRLAPDKLEGLVDQVASALDEAAAKGIVHRDIKPQNLFLLERASSVPIWKILDFGASKLAQHKGTLTEGRVVGTPAYMAPEQARGEDVSPVADVYALAAIAYRCLTGRPPFSGKDLPTTLYNVCYSMPPQPSQLAELPTSVDSVLAIGLAKTARDRFESAGELAAALRQALAGQRDDWFDRRAQALLAHLPWGAAPR